MSVESQSIERYLQETLGISASLGPWPDGDRLPLYLRDGFRFYQALLLKTPCLFLVDRADEAPSPATIRKQLDQVRPKWEGELIYVRSQVASHGRKRLIQQRVPFLVPGNQLYLPMLGIDLREHFRKQRQTTPSLKPATQALVLHLLIHQDAHLQTPVEFAQRLGYTKMTMSRAFDELEEEQLGEVVKEGRERCLRPVATKRQLWEKALPLMQSPVQRRSWVRHPDLPPGVVTAGLSALARYSMLVAPNTPTIAVSKDRWKSTQDRSQSRKAVADDPQSVEVEVWTYNPELFAKEGVVDPFSLYLSLKEDQDERVQASLEAMLEGALWS